jgi:hypothetical protein
MYVDGKRLWRLTRESGQPPEGVSGCQLRISDRTDHLRQAYVVIEIGATLEDTGPLNRGVVFGKFSCSALSALERVAAVGKTAAPCTSMTTCRAASFSSVAFTLNVRDGAFSGQERCRCNVLDLLTRLRATCPPCVASAKEERLFIWEHVYTIGFLDPKAPWFKGVADSVANVIKWRG